MWDGSRVAVATGDAEDVGECKTLVVVLGRELEMIVDPLFGGVVGLEQVANERAARMAVERCAGFIV